LVDAPEMCWSQRRIYDRPLTECYADIDASIARLRAQGATAMVLGGMSMGGNAALGYASTHTGLIGVIACAPAHDAGTLGYTPRIEAALAAAKEAIAAGKGDVPQTFPDSDSSRRGGPQFTVRASPRAYVSFLDPSGPANIEGDLPQITVPVIWVAGTQDPTQSSSADNFARLPANPNSKYVSVNADHLETPDAGAAAIVNWVRALAAAQGS
jgi:pimeloyl-ACP methyl ester carboxylesterase